MHLVVPRTRGSHHRRGSAHPVRGRAHAQLVEEALRISPCTRARFVVPVDVRNPGAHDTSRGGARGARHQGQVLDKVILSRTVPYFRPQFYRNVRSRSPGQQPSSLLSDIPRRTRRVGVQPEIIVRVEKSGRLRVSPWPALEPHLRRSRESAAAEGIAIRSEGGIRARHLCPKPCTTSSERCVTRLVVGQRVHEVRERGTHSTGLTCSGRLARDDGPGTPSARLSRVTASGVPRKRPSRTSRPRDRAPRALRRRGPHHDHEGPRRRLVLRAIYRQRGRTWLAPVRHRPQSEPSREFEETCEKLGSVARFLVPSAADRSIIDTDTDCDAPR